RATDEPGVRLPASLARAVLLDLETGERVAEAALAGAVVLLGPLVPRLPFVRAEVAQNLVGVVREVRVGLLAVFRRTALEQARDAVGQTGVLGVPPVDVDATPQADSGQRGARRSARVGVVPVSRLLLTGGDRVQERDRLLEDLVVDFEAGAFGRV